MRIAPVGGRGQSPCARPQSREPDGGETDGRLRINRRPRRGPSGEQRHRRGPALRGQALRKDGPAAVSSLESLVRVWTWFTEDSGRLSVSLRSGWVLPVLPFLALRLVGTEGSIEPSSVGVRTAEALGPLPF